MNGDPYNPRYAGEVEAAYAERAAQLSNDHTLDTCELSDCDAPAADNSPAYEYVADPETGAAVDREVRGCAEHLGAPTHMGPDAVTAYWGKIAEGGDIRSAQDAAIAALPADTQRWYRGEYDAEAFWSTVDRVSAQPDAEADEAGWAR